MARLAIVWLTLALLLPLSRAEAIPVVYALEDRAPLRQEAQSNPAAVRFEGPGGGFPSPRITIDHSQIGVALELTEDMFSVGRLISCAGNLLDAYGEILLTRTGQGSYIRGEVVYNCGEANRVFFESFSGIPGPTYFPEPTFSVEGGPGRYLTFLADCCISGGCCTEIRAVEVGTYEFVRLTPLAVSLPATSLMLLAGLLVSAATYCRRWSVPPPQLD